MSENEKRKKKEKKEKKKCTTRINFPLFDKKEEVLFILSGIFIIPIKYPLQNKRK